MTDRPLTKHDLTCKIGGAHPSEAYKAACPICNPTKTVPELNAAAGALLTSNLVADLRADVVVPYKDGYEPLRAPASDLMKRAADEIERLRAAVSNLVSVFSCSSSATERQREIENGRAALSGDFSKMEVILCTHCGGENRVPVSSTHETTVKSASHAARYTGAEIHRGLSIDNHKHLRELEYVLAKDHDEVWHCCQAWIAEAQRRQERIAVLERQSSAQETNTDGLCKRDDGHDWDDNGRCLHCPAEKPAVNGKAD